MKFNRNECGSGEGCVIVMIALVILFFLGLFDIWPWSPLK